MSVYRNSSCFALTRDSWGSSKSPIALASQAPVVMPLALALGPLDLFQHEFGVLGQVLINLCKH